MDEQKPAVESALTEQQRMDADRLREAWQHGKNAGRYSQKDLAAQWGVTTGLVSQYINGHTALNVEAKLRFSKYMRRPAHTIWPDFEFTESVTMTLPPASEEAAKLIADLPEGEQQAFLLLLRNRPRPAA